MARFDTEYEKKKAEIQEFGVSKGLPRSVQTALVERFEFVYQHKCKYTSSLSYRLVDRIAWDVCSLFSRDVSERFVAFSAVFDREMNIVKQSWLTYLHIHGVRLCDRCTRT